MTLFSVRLEPTGTEYKYESGSLIGDLLQLLEIRAVEMMKQIESFFITSFIVVMAIISV